MFSNTAQRHQASTTRKKEQANKVWVYANTCTAYEGSLSHIPFAEEKIKCQFYNDKHELIALEKIGTTAQNNRKTKGLHFKPIVSSTESYSSEAFSYTSLSTPSITALPAVFVDSFENENGHSNYSYSSNYSTQTQSNLTQKIWDISESETVMADNPCFDNINLNNFVTSIDSEDCENCYSSNAFSQANKFNNQFIETTGQQLEDSLDVRNENPSELQKTPMSLNPDLTYENFLHMSVEENPFLSVTYLPPDYIDYFNESIEESPYPKHASISSGSTGEVNLDELKSWPDDLISQESTDFSFAEEGRTVDQGSVPEIELEKIAERQKNAISSSSLAQSPMTFFTSKSKRSSVDDCDEPRRQHKASKC
ncbi:Uncharacterised protein [Legionella beliardensis]|uniref:Uncharacterized protein n=1 Tax=Legionella beliardensis TaxID=91822 RepID=A0A378I359_9GAMM|nr:hypothetical protein [Legionella beliardensis]STX29190.1 Uncharacterised protein [Legionella beliardensis]